MDIILITLSAVGGVSLTAGLGLLAKHLTIDHNSIDHRLDEIIEKLENLEDKECHCSCQQ